MTKMSSHTNRLHAHLNDKEIEDIFQFLTGEGNYSANATVRHINQILLNKGDNFSIGYKAFIAWLSEEYPSMFAHYKKIQAYREANSAINQRVIAEKKEVKFTEAFEKEEKEDTGPRAPWLNTDGTVKDMLDDLSPEEYRARRRHRHATDEPHEEDLEEL
jgi:hypothetical protein